MKIILYFLILSSIKIMEQSEISYWVYKENAVMLVKNIYCNQMLYKSDTSTFSIEDSCIYLNNKTVYLKPDSLPEYIGGQEKMDEFIKSNLNYPKELPDNNSCCIYVGFIINKSGGIEEIGIRNSINIVYDECAVKLIKQMPNWEPGLVKGFPVNCLITIRVSFF